MSRTVTSHELYEEIEHGSVPMILDVRNQDEFAAWRVEGNKPVPTRNVPIWLAVEDIEALAKEIPDNTVVICAHGNGSDLLLDMLAAEGRKTRNLTGGTQAWAALLIAKELDCLPIGLVGWQIQRPAKACISYVIGVPGQGAIVVDPARFLDTYLELSQSQGMTIRHVIDTHVHADHVTGGPALAQFTGATYHVPIEDTGGKTPFPNEPLADGARLDLGDITIETLAIKMPGHTPGTTCVHVPGSLLLTGDTVFVRGVGRPDLTGKADELARELFHTVHDRLRPLDPATRVLPAHWSTDEEMGADGLVSTDLESVFTSLLMQEEDLTAFVEAIISSLPSAPDIYDTIRLVNSGQSATDEEIEILEIGKNQCAASTTT